MSQIVTPQQVWGSPGGHKGGWYPSPPCHAQAPAHVLPNPALPKTQSQPFCLPSPPQLHQHSRGVCWGVLERGTDPRLGPPPPPAAARVKIKLIPSLPPRALSDGSIIPVNPCQASLPQLGARLPVGGLLGPPQSMGSRGWGAEGAPQERGKVGPRGRVEKGRRKWRLWREHEEVWGAEWGPQIHRHPIPRGLDTPHRPGEGWCPPFTPHMWGQDSTGGVTSPQNTHCAPKPHGVTPSVPPS